MAFNLLAISKYYLNESKLLAKLMAQHLPIVVAFQVTYLILGCCKNEDNIFEMIKS